MSDKPEMQMIGRYQLLECMEEGATATTYRATDTASGRKVVLRILSVPASANEQIRNFMESLRDPYSDRRIQDPSVLRLLDVGMHEQRYFVVHEDFDGVPLDRFLAEHKSEFRERLRLARCVAESLRAVHAYKAVHGDVKPANILVSTRVHGRTLVKLALTDLGQATSDGMVSIYGELLGTPKYMAPEQITGRRATPASDLFALGVIFYEMLGGTEPFRGGTPLGYLHANRETTATPLCELDSRIPSGVSRIVDRMIARETRSRYRNVQSVLDDLDRAEAVLDGAKPEPAVPGSDSVFADVVEQAACNVTAWRTVAVLSLSAAAILLIAVLFMLRDGSQPKAPEVVPEQPVAPGPGISIGSADNSAQNSFTETLSSPQEKSFEAIQADARRLQGMGRYSEALTMLRTFEKQNRDSGLAPLLKQEIAGARFGIAGDFLTKGDYDQCAKVYREIIRDYPNTQWSGMGVEKLGQVLLRQAENYEKHGELSKAVKALENLLKECPKSGAAQHAERLLPPWRVRLGQAQTPSDPNRAVETLNKVSSTTGTKPAPAATKATAQALFARGIERASTADWEAAIADYRAAYAANPGLALQIKPKEAEAMAQRALQLKKQGDFAASLTMWNNLHRLYPQSLGYQRAKPEMSDLILAAGQLGKDRMNNPALIWAIAENARKENDSKKRYTLLTRLVREYPKDEHAKIAKDALADRDLSAAKASLQQGRLDEAKDRMAAIAKAYPESAAGKFAAREVKRWDATPEGMVYVPTGSFTFGLSAEDAARLLERYSVPKIISTQWFGPQQPQQQVALSGFYIEKNEVTNAEYKQFVDAVKFAPPPSSDWSGADIKPGLDNLPVTNVSWEDAVAYAKWAGGKRLPTEREWEKAARGFGSNLFPWGETFDPSRAVLGMGNVTGGAHPVGSIPQGKSLFGCNDMIGNVMEWTSSDYGPYDGEQPSGLLFDKGQKVARGAGFDEAAAYFCLVTSRFNLLPETKGSALGFRCAKDAP